MECCDKDLNEDGEHAEEGEDDYYERLQACAPGDSTGLEESLCPVAELTQEVGEDDESYYSRHGNGASLVVEEGGIVWQSLLRDQAQSCLDKSAGDSSMPAEITPLEDSSALELSKQFLFSFLPRSNYVFVKLLNHIANIKDASNLKAHYQFYVDDILHPSFVLSVEALERESKCRASLFAPHTLSDPTITAIAQWLVKHKFASIMFEATELSLLESLSASLLSADFLNVFDTKCVMVALLEPSSPIEASAASLPPEYSFKTLTKSDAILIESMWAYKSDSSLPFVISIYIIILMRSYITLIFWFALDREPNRDSSLLWHRA